MQVGEALSRARGRVEALEALEARALLEAASGMTPAQQLAHPERVLSTAVLEQFEDYLARRAAGEPVAYLLGRREFYGREFLVNESVLIPRPETEHLVEVAFDSIRRRASPRVLDLGTGSGIVAITLALMKPDAAVTAVDASAAALQVAADNARRLGATVTCVLSDWYQALGQARFDLIVSNPPYIAAGDEHLREGDLRFEPQGALTDGSFDGLHSLTTLIAGAPAHLAQGGWLWLEHGFDQGPACRALLSAAGFAEIRSVRDLAGLERVSGGCWNAGRG